MAFTNVGHTTLAPGSPIRWGVIRNNGADFGAQFVGAHPENPGSEVIASDESKAHTLNGTFGYNATLLNVGQFATGISLQGGGLSEGFNNVGHMTLAPSTPIRWGVIRNNGADFGAQFVGAHPENPGSEVIASDESKAHTLNGTFGYNATFLNVGQFATGISLQGGGFV